MAKKKKQEIEIVLIGGNKEQFEYLKQLLADLDSHLYHVLWSASYKGGVAYARENQPDLFLVNYEADDPRGLEFISAIRRRDCIKPVILLVDKYDYYAEKKAESVGAEQYLEKNIDNPVAFEVTLLETIERAKSLNAIRKSESRMRGIFIGASIGIALVDLDRLIVQGNPSVYRILGYDAEQICAMDIVDDFAHSDDAEPIRNAIDRIINRKRVNTIIECRFLCKNGSWKWIQLTMSLFGETDMPPQFIICLIDDISEKKSYPGSIGPIRVPAQRAVR